MKDFDYVEWAAESRETMRKYGQASETIEALLRTIVTYAQIGRTEEANRLKAQVEKLLRESSLAKANDSVSLPVPRGTSGDIVLGDLAQGEEFRGEFKIPIAHLNRHVAIFASAGHGKTTLIINTLHQLVENKINFLAFDFKQDFRHLKHLPVIVLRWNWLRINPFVAPEGVDEFHWLSLVCDLFAHVYGWFHASKNYMFEFVNDEYQRTKENGCVRLQRVKEAIESSHDKEFERQRMKTVVLNRLSSLVTRLHEVFDCEEGFPIGEILNYPVVVEMDDCDPDDASFLVSLFLVYAFEQRKARSERGSLSHVIVFDEAHRIFYRQSEYRETEAELGSSIINQIPRIIRDYNEGLIFATQEPSQINNSVMANTDLKIVGYLGNGADIEAIEKAFQLGKEDTSLIKRLKIGQFMVQKSGINEGSPFLIQGFDYPFEKKVSDGDLKERMKGFIAVMQSEPKSESRDGKLLQLPKISEKAAKMLSHVGQHPLRSISQRYKQLGMHPTDGREAIVALEQSAMIRAKSIRLSPGRPSVYVEPTDSGLLWLKEHKVDVSAWSDYIGHVGLEHRIFQWMTAKGLEKQGYKVEKEYTIGKKRLDVYAEKGEEKIGVEVCISPKMDFPDAYEAAKSLSQLVFLCKDENIITIMQREAASSDSNNPKFKFLVGYRYLNTLYSYHSNSSNNENNSSDTPSIENNSPTNTSNPKHTHENNPGGKD